MNSDTPLLDRLVEDGRLLYELSVRRGDDEGFVSDRNVFGSRKPDPDVVRVGSRSYDEVVFERSVDRPVIGDIDPGENVFIRDATERGDATVPLVTITSDEVIDSAG